MWLAATMRPASLVALMLLLALLLACNAGTAAAVMPSTVPLAQRIDNFLQWLSEKGARLEGASIASEGVKGGLGLKATADLEPDAVFASLPLSSLFTVEHVFLDEWAQTHLEPLSDTEATAVYLARMRLRGDSDWDAWAQLLPAAFDSFPLFWSDAQLDQLQSSAVRAFTERRLNRARATYASLSPEARSTVSLEQFLWGLSALWSRTHGVAVRDAQGAWQKAAAFVPVADMLNMATPMANRAAGEGADGGANVDCKTNDASTHFECFTLQAVHAGQELLVSYGAATPGQPGGAGGIGNGQLLLDYGFALEQNPHDIVVLETMALRPVGGHARAEAEATGSDSRSDSVVSEGVLHMQQVLIRTLLRRDPAANHTFQLRWPSAAAAAAATATTVPDGSDDLAALPADLLLLMRIHALDDGFLAQLGAGGRDAVMSRLKHGGILFPSHELQAAGMLRARVDALLHAYGTTLAEDEAALGSSGSSTPGGAESDIARWCLRVRAGEKRLLHFHSALLASYQHKLRGGIDAEKREAARQRRKSNEERPRQEEEDEEESLHLEL